MVFKSEAEFKQYSDLPQFIVNHIFNSAMAIPEQGFVFFVVIKLKLYQVCEPQNNK